MQIATRRSFAALNMTKLAKRCACLSPYEKTERISVVPTTDYKKTCTEHDKFRANRCEGSR